MDLIQQLEYEMALWQAGMHVLAGIDEAGRGALAGPLVAAAVCCDDDRHVERVAVFETAHLVRDSKTLSAKQRRAARDFICEAFGNCGVGIVSSEEIDFFGIVAANRLQWSEQSTSLAAFRSSCSSTRSRSTAASHSGESSMGTLVPSSSLRRPSLLK